ncbi:MAG: LysR substrate-binding domain-containing protein, partial [Cryobacterium sp.]
TDVALVVVTGDTPPGVCLHPLSSQKMVVLCHPDHPVAGLAEVDLETLRAEPLIGFQAGWGAHMLARRAFAAAGFEYRAAMEVNDVHPLLELVGYNLGVAIVPTSFALKRPDDLVAVPLPAAVPEWTVAVAVADEPSPAASAFLEQLLEDVAAAQAASVPADSPAVSVSSAA